MANESKDDIIAKLTARLEVLEAKSAQQHQAPTSRLRSLRITASKDMNLETGRRRLSRLDETVRPARVVESENVHGIDLRAGQEVTIDVLDAQVAAFQAAVDAGHIIVEGMPKSKQDLS
jgi:hypothetical protein